MEVKSKLFATFLILISGCSQSSANDPEFFGANFSLSSCVQNAGNADALDDFMTNRMKIKAPVPPELSKYFLKGSNGKVWSFSSPHGNYAVAYRDDGVCMVFIKETDVSKYISHMNDSLKRISEKSGWTVSTDNIPMFAGEKELKTYQFTVVLPDKKVSVVMSAVTQVVGNFQMAFSTNLLSDLTSQ
jgi:hypothetical protein